MTDCERYRSDPEEDAAHLESCEACRIATAELAELDRNVARLGLEPKSEFQSQLVEHLPLAPWEGARYRSWGLVGVVLTTLLVLATGAFLAAGVNPVQAVRTLVSSTLPYVSPWDLATSFSELISSAPASFHITIGILFVVVNLILLVLLRRRPRGYDA